MLDHKSASITCLSSCRDPESGLYTIGHFQSVLSQELARLDRGERPLSLVLLAVPQLTDQHWSHLGRLILASLRSIDLAARLDAERVSVLLPDATLGRARRWAGLLLAEITQHPVLGRHVFSWGLVLARPREGRTSAELLSLAEAGLGQDEELNPDDHALNSVEDLNTSIATDERDLLFAGFQALTHSKQ